MRGRPATTTLLGLALALALAGVALAEQDEESFDLEVIRVIDADLSAIEDDRMARIFDSARQTFTDKFGFGSLRFVDRGLMPIEDFLARHPATDCAAMQARYPIDGSRVPPEVLAAGRRWLSRWTLDELRGFFPADQRAELTDLGAIRRRLMDEFGRKIEWIKKVQLNGESLIEPSLFDKRSYTRFVCAVREQRQYDLILTNAFLLFDAADEPFPHAVFGKLKAGGASMDSPHRQALRSRALMTSTFEIDNDLEFFKNAEVAGLSPAEKDELLGAYILAHELGHAIFKIPDSYDHPAGCLMTTKMNQGYLAGYNEMKSHQDQCPKCRVYVDARLAYFRGERLFREGRYADSLKAFASVVRTTPKNVDGNYRSYMSEVAVWAARCYERLAMPGKATRMVERALKLNKRNREAQELLDRFLGPDPIPAARPAGAGVAGDAR